MNAVPSCRGRLACALVLAGLALGGCGQTVSSMMVSPGKYDYYPCQSIETQIKEKRARVAELEDLMARSSQGVGGGLINSMAYRSDYLQNRGELDELTRTADDKKCTSQSPLTSDRSVF